MGANLSMFKKGMVLIAIPLLLQWAFIGLFLHIREEGQEDHRWLSHTKEVATEAGHIRRLLLEAHNDMCGFVITGDPAFARAYEEAVQILPQKIAALQRRVRDPGQRLRITRIADDASALLGYLDELNGFMQAGKPEQAVAAIKALTGHERMNDLRQEIDAFLRQQHELERARDLAVEERWRHEDWWLGTGAVAALLLGLALTYAFSRGISRRLNAMVQNAEGLAEGEAPLPALGGEDVRVAGVGVAPPQVVVQRPGGGGVVGVIRPGHDEHPQRSEVCFDRVRPRRVRRGEAQLDPVSRTGFDGDIEHPEDALLCRHRGSTARSCGNARFAWSRRR